MYPKISPQISVTIRGGRIPGVFSSPQSTARSHTGGRSGTGTLVLPKGQKKVDDHWGFSMSHS